MLKIVVVILIIIAAAFSFRLVSTGNKSAVSDLANQPSPTPIAVEIEYSDPNLDTQIEEVQEQLDQLTANEKAYTQIDQNAD